MKGKIFTEKLDPLTKKFVETHPDTCAMVTTNASQKFFYAVLFLFLLLLLKYRWDIFVFLVCGGLMLLYAGAVLLRAVAAIYSVCGRGELRVKPEELVSLKDEELPCYTILLPLYKEPEVAQKILKRIAGLDYPPEKLDVKLLLESDDSVTYQELTKARLPQNFTIIRIPDAQPKTKPRACNFGLREARGEFCVIYDAEDIPDPDQLKKAFLVFRHDTAGKLACVQAKLNYYNSRQNWLTRFFTVEYTTYFDLVLAGWQRFNIPLPLGGTSNHFRTEILRRAGGWDPFNVTEDCELGIRIYENHWETAVLDSTTLEEANSRLWNWMRQRSRWVKGFIQTHLAHYRNPLVTIRRLGLRGAIGCYMSVGGSSLMMLTNLVYWPLTLFYLFLICHGLCSGESLSSILIASNTQEHTYQGVHIGSFVFKPWPLLYIGPGESPFWSLVSQIFCVFSVFLLFSNFLLVGVHVAAVIKRKFYHLILPALLMPFYWILISCGAWKGFLQIFTKPFYWEKTVHGLDSEYITQLQSNKGEQPE